MEIVLIFLAVFNIAAVIYFSDKIRKLEKKIPVVITQHDNRISKISRSMFSSLYGEK